MTIENIVAQIITASEPKFLEDNELSLSCNKLTKTNNGNFVSDKQARFFEYRMRSGKNLDDTGLPKTIRKLLQSMGTGITGIISSPKIDRFGDLRRRFVYFLDNQGVRKFYMFSWEYKDGLPYEEAKAQVDREFENMSFRSRERNWGLQPDMINEIVEKWLFLGERLKWSRPS